MFRNFTDLKAHYGTKTMLEVILDPKRRGDLTNRPLYKNGRVVNMVYRARDGLIAYDHNVMGIGISVKVTEEYLEQLRISQTDFNTILGPNAKHIPSVDLLEIIEASKLEHEQIKKDGNSAIGIAAMSIMILLAVVTQLPTGDGAPPTPQPKGKK